MSRDILVTNHYASLEFLVIVNLRAGRSIHVGSRGALPATVAGSPNAVIWPTSQSGRGGVRRGAAGRGGAGRGGVAGGCGRVYSSFIKATFADNANNEHCITTEELCHYARRGKPTSLTSWLQ